MLLPAFDPVAFSIGPFAIRYYALAYLFGILGGFLLIRRMIATPSLWAHRQSSHSLQAQRPIPAKMAVDDLLTYVLFGIILGGRLGYVLFYSPHLLLSFSRPFAETSGDGLVAAIARGIVLPDILALWEGGMSFHGGLLGVFLGVAFFARRHQQNFWVMIDMVAAVAPLGLFLGRLANFINGELYGRPSDVPWAMVFATDPQGLSRHPSQLYEAGLEGLVLGLLMFWLVVVGKGLTRPGLLSAVFLCFYSIARISAEFFRQPDAQIPVFPFSLTMGIMLCVPLLVCGVFLLVRCLKGHFS